ncbi:hypothetical protein FKM82_017720 [Ascaphus truei]
MITMLHMGVCVASWQSLKHGLAGVSCRQEHRVKHGLTCLLCDQIPGGKRQNLWLVSVLPSGQKTIAGVSGSKESSHHLHVPLQTRPPVTPVQLGDLGSRGGVRKYQFLYHCVRTPISLNSTNAPY